MHAKIVTASAVGIDDSIVLTSVGCAVAYDLLVELAPAPEARGPARDVPANRERGRLRRVGPELLIDVELTAEIVMDRPDVVSFLVGDKETEQEQSSSFLSSTYILLLRLQVNCR